jgi:hypothetical protein
LVHPVQLLRPRNQLKFNLLQFKQHRFKQRLLNQLHMQLRLLQQRQNPPLQYYKTRT